MVDSVDCTLEELNDSKRCLDSASNVAEEQEKKLIEQEESERIRREEEKAERKHKEQGKSERLLKEEENAELKRNEEENYKATSVNTDEAVDEVFEDDTLPNIYDIGLVPAEKLSIPEVYDVKEERIVNARDFSLNMRVN